MKQQRVELGPVGSPKELNIAIKKIARMFPEHLLLFRGQNQIHDTVRSGLARPDARFEPDVEQGFGALAGRILGQNKNSLKNIPFRKAVLQHYGYKTNYVDLTEDPIVAAWFALNIYSSRKQFYVGIKWREYEVVSYSRMNKGFGYILVLGIQDSLQMQDSRKLFNISELVPFIRPTRQKAWLLYDRQPLLPDPNEFWIGTISIDSSKFKLKLQTDYLFPIPQEDSGYKYLLQTPFVQTPSEWIDHLINKKKKETRKNEFRMVLGSRAFNIPEYPRMKNTDEYDHKWKDQSLSEPKPMQLWRGWNFDLSQRFPGVKGDISNSTKITLSPNALVFLFKPGRKTRLRWPDLGTNEILFTFSQYEHDKVLDIEYPYHGVWLHKDRDLIIEHPITSDEDSLNVHAGHCYEFVGQELYRQDIRKPCQCPFPRRHDQRVRAMLRLSTLIEFEIIILVPHPLRIPNWYFAL